MPQVWFALKKSLACTKSLLCDVHEPKTIGDSISNEAGYGCLRSKSNIRDVFCGSKRYSEKPQVGSSSRSIASSEVLISIIDEIESHSQTHDFSVSSERKARLRPISNFVARKGQGQVHAGSATFDCKGMYFPSNPRKSMMSNQFNDHSKSFCHECGGVFKNSNDVESHHLSKHAVTELAEGDWSREVIELICQRNWFKSKRKYYRIERVFKVHNSPKTLSCFEEHREIVKSKASKPEGENKNTRCSVDGNELLRFHATTFYDSEILCNLESCGVCQNLRHGFGQKEGNGVFTFASSGRALESIVVNEEVKGMKKALMVCRVIAGRIWNRAMEKDDLEFDSLGRKMGQSSEFEELHVLNPRAVLPSFVVTYKQ